MIKLTKERLKDFPQDQLVIEEKNCLDIEFDLIKPRVVFANLILHMLQEEPNSLL